MNKIITLITFFAGLMLFGYQLQAQIDSLMMNTGETLVGEVKDLKQGVIVIETEYSDDDLLNGTR